MPKCTKCKSVDERTLVRIAVEMGWEVVGRNRSNHLELRHKVTGVLTRIPSRVRGGELMRNVRRQLQKQAGLAPGIAPRGFRQWGEGTPSRNTGPFPSDAPRKGIW